MQHHFNVDVATQYGVHSAILLDNFYYWIEKNRANGNNFYDGHYWTYNSKRALSELFPYLTEKQVRTAIDNLVNDGVLITGNYNRATMDRTTWYAITKKGYELLGDCRVGLFDLPLRANAFDLEGKASDLNGKAIPNEKTTNEKPDIKISPEDLVISSSDSDVLEEKDKKEETVGAGSKPRRNYTVKPQTVVDESIKLNRQQKKQLKVQDMLSIVPLEYGPDLINALGDYLDMRMKIVASAKVDKEWFEKEWNENIYPAIQKYSISEVVQSIRTVAIPRQYKRCFISINTGSSTRRQSFNDSVPYTDEEIQRAKEKGRKAIEQAKKDGTYRREF